MKPVLEVCAHSVESAVSAERGGAKISQITVF